MKRINKDEYYLNIAKAVSERSTCLRRRYGCVIVKNNEVIATGYNGSARGTDNCCDIYTECPRKNKEHNSGDYSDCPAIHAEQNAMLSAARKDMIDSELYLYGEEFVGSFSFEIYAVPCPICERMILNAGIKRVVNKSGDVKGSGG